MTIDEFSERFVRIRADFGYMEMRRLTPILNACGAAKLDIDKDTTSFVFANPVIVGKSHGGWRVGSDCSSSCCSATRAR